MASLELPPSRKPGKPGWYVDPDRPTRERWWTGSIWESAVAPLAQGPFGPEFERSMRPAANRLAGRVRFVAFGAIITLLLSLIDGSVLGPGDASPVAVILLAATFVLGALAEGIGWVALRRSATLGGDGAARASMFVGGAAISLAVVAMLWRG
jgi:uncharacterized protein DUF2510